MRSWSIVLVVAAGVGLPLGSAPGTQMQTAEQHFLRGKELIEANGADSMGSTRQGFEEGIAEVRKAIEQGYEDKAAAYKLLAAAYNEFAYVYAQRDPKRQGEIFVLQRQALEKLMELRPGDARVRADHARVAGNKEMEIAAWRDVVAAEPSDGDARWSLGMLLLYHGQIDEAVTHLKTMVKVASLHQAQIYGSGARGSLIEKGRKEDAAEVMKILERRNEAYLLPNQVITLLSKLQPGEGRMRAELAKVVKDPYTQTGSLQNILAGNALHTRAMFSLGMVYVFDRQYEVGVMYLKRLFESATLWRIQNYAKIAENFLIEEGKRAEAAEIAALMKKRAAKRN